MRRSRVLLAVSLLVAAVAGLAAWLAPRDVWPERLWMPDNYGPRLVTWRSEQCVVVHDAPGGAAFGYANQPEDTPRNWQISRPTPRVRSWLERLGIPAGPVSSEMYRATGVRFHADGSEWVELRLGGYRSTWPPASADLAGTWDHTTGTGAPAGLLLAPDGSASGLPRTNIWGVWDDRVCVSRSVPSMRELNVGGAEAGSGDDAFEAVVSPDRRSYAGTDSVGRPVCGRKRDDR